MRCPRRVSRFQSLLFALTLNYERFLTNQFGLGAGFMMIGTSDGMVSVLPLYASFLTGDVHSRHDRRELLSGS